MNLQCDSWSDIWSLSYSSQLLCSNSFSADWELIHPLEFHRNPLSASNRQERKEKGAAVDSKIEKKPKGRDTSRDGEDCVKGGAVKKMKHCTAPSLLPTPSIFKRELYKRTWSKKISSTVLLLRQGSQAERRREPIKRSLSVNSNCCLAGLLASTHHCF